VPVIVLQGAEDPFVAPVNAEQVITQWAQTNDLADDGGVDDDGIDATPDAVLQGVASSPHGHGYTVYTYHDGNGRVIMKRYLVAGMGHAWSGGVPDPSWVFLYLKDPFVDPRGPDASGIMWEFFSAYRLISPDHGEAGVSRLADAHGR
jgi:poly(3-hydroxybutyrate) depolymerase